MWQINIATNTQIKTSVNGPPAKPQPVQGMPDSPQPIVLKPNEQESKS